MKPLTLMGIALVVIGIVSLVYQGITYSTRENVFEIGPVRVTAEEKKTIPLPPILGVGALIGGVVLLVVERKKR